MTIQPASGPGRTAARIADSLIRRFPDPDAIHWAGQENHFSWQAGYVMFALEKLWRATGESRYLDYIRRYVDQQVGEGGEVPDFDPSALDNFLPGYAILLLYELTGHEKYRLAVRTIRQAFDMYPRNADGSFWHAAWAKHQLWVDGVFMGQMFLARYGKTIGDGGCAFLEVGRQMRLAADRCLKPNGLLLHGWDESRAAGWADRTTGLASEVWSEGLGWYAVLIADVLDFLPADHPEAARLLALRRRLCAALKAVQDPVTGLWCQVVDKPGAAGNWNETSGSGMFLYLLNKSLADGIIDPAEFFPAAARAYAGLTAKVRTGADGLADVVDCSSIGIQDDYAAYVGQAKEINTFAGIASFILGAGSAEAFFADGR